MNIFKRKAVKRAQRLVWRMSATNPLGEFVCPSDRKAKMAGPVEGDERGFRTSSLELKGGSEVIETEMNTLPGELVDAFLRVDR